MKKQYKTPLMLVNSFEYTDGIAIPFDPNGSTEEALGKSRDTDDNEVSFGGDSEWKEGLW